MKTSYGTVCGLSLELAAGEAVNKRRGEVARADGFNREMRSDSKRRLCTMTGRAPSIIATRTPIPAPTGLLSQWAGVLHGVHFCSRGGGPSCPDSRDPIRR